MRRSILLSVVLFGASLSAAPTVCAAAMLDHPSGATAADIRQLQSEANMLDDSLRLVDDAHPRAGEFRRRESEIRHDLTRLRTQVRAHQRSTNQGLGASKAEVEDIRRAIADLRGEVDASVESRGTFGARGNSGGYTSTGRADELNVPDGTEIQIRLEEALSSKTARREDRISATVVESVRSDNGLIAIPTGTRVTGTVFNAEAAQRPARGGRLELTFDSMALSGGQNVGLRSRVVNMEQGGVAVDKKRTGIGALVGGILGAVVGNTKGAIVGAVLGGGGAVITSRGDDVELPAGTILTLRLERPVVVLRR